MNDTGPARVARGAPIAVIMISLNESHNMRDVLENLLGWAQEIFLVDSYSSDDTVDIALQHHVHVVQRRFRGFGDQWNFALAELPITAPWTMKLDPDERLSDELKASIEALTRAGDDTVGIAMRRRLWFMGKPLPVRQRLLRAWRTGKCRFSDVAVNEHPVVRGPIAVARGDIEHHDSPGLEHWLDKQNRYTTAEAEARFRGARLSARPRILGTALERRMWLKKNFWRMPGRYACMFLYNYVLLGAWRAGKTGYIWARLRSDVYRLIEYKLHEMRSTGRTATRPAQPTGKPDARVPHYD